MEKDKMHYQIAPLHSATQYKYAITVARYNGKLLLGRHAKRGGWELQGGHIEEGETPLEAARRELQEESGAKEYTIEPLFDILDIDEKGNIRAASRAFFAEVFTLGEIPEEFREEIAEVKAFSHLPENLSFPQIVPVLVENVFEKVGWQFPI